MKKNKVNVVDLPDELWYEKVGERLAVLRAASSSDCIRFYFNEQQYLVGYDNDPTSIYFEDENKPWKNRVQPPEDNTKKISRHIKILVLLGVILAFVCFFALFVCASIFKKLFGGELLYLCSIAIITSIFSLLSVVILIAYDTPKETKSKHSAEHMMVNFMEKHKRLPKTLEELKKASRFSSDCGTRNRVESCARVSVQILISSVVGYFSKFLVSGDGAGLIIYIVSYLIVYIGIGLLSQPGRCLHFLIVPVRRVFNYVGQLGNTTKNVRDEDLHLAYRVCWVWIQIVYPEYFYDDIDELCVKER